MQARDWTGALGQIDRALGIEPKEAKSLVYRAQCLAALARSREACEAAAEALRTAPTDATVLDSIGGVFSRADDQQNALAAFDRAVALAPGNARFIFNRATVLRFLGRIGEAEADYDRVIALEPNDHEAYLNRSELRTQSADANHIGVLEGLLAHGIEDWRGEVQIRYALAKEYEDTGEHGKSFQQLEAGAKKRRDHLQYDVAADVATVDWIIEAFPSTPVYDPDAAERERGNAPLDSPIFIVGLPRSGSTLLDRILGSHSAVHCAGELNHFALSVVDSVRRCSGAAPSTRRELVARSAGLDFAALGRDYLARVTPAPAGARHFTDKMPLNYLYCGLIRRALPNAKIVHVIRQPMAVCYAMYKTLFKDGYPFSYDLNDIARYYIAYRRLMDHWNSSMPGAILTMSYETLVEDQLGCTQQLLDFCGLEWQDACAEFHRNSTPATTASAVQVRRPLYNTSVDQWRQYGAHLAPLNDQLSAAGIATGWPP
jgi:Tfp pilus assembly protein PilF